MKLLEWERKEWDQDMNQAGFEIHCYAMAQQYPNRLKAASFTAFKLVHKSFLTLTTMFYFY